MRAVSRLRCARSATGLSSAVIRRVAPRVNTVIAMSAPSSCPCLSGKTYQECCEPAHSGAHPASTPEAALRARLSAFSKGLGDYLAETSHPDFMAIHAKGDDVKAAYAANMKNVCSQFDFGDLQVIKVEDGADPSTEGFVTFSFRMSPKSGAGEGKITTETGRFVKVGQQWMFTDYKRA